MRHPVEFSNWPLNSSVRYGPYRAVVRHVVDGDTFDVLIDVGFNDYPYRTIRLAGIDAPEKNRAETREAGLASMRFLQELLPVGTKVIIDPDPDPDSFGRYIAVVDTLDGEEVNDTLVKAGHAVYRKYS